MKKLFFILFLAFLTLPSKELYPQGWQFVNSGTSNGLFAVSFGNDNVGYIAPFTNGLEPILKTTNGGLNWFSITSPILHGNYKDIFFLNENTGYCASSDNQQINETNIAMTTDGGNSWIPKTFIPSLPVSQEITSIFFVNISTGFVTLRTQFTFGGGKVYKTTNSGSSWNEQVLSPLHNPFVVKFKDQNTGIIACDSGYIYRTTNGGTSWQSQYLGLNTLLYDIEYVNPDTVFIVSQASRIYKSFNGGVNWVLQTYTPTNLALRTVDFINNNTGILIGRTGQQNHTIVTTNGGNSWKTVDTIMTSMVLFKMAVQDPKKAVLIGLGGEIFYSNTLGVPIPDIPILQSPGNNSMQTTLTPSLRWQVVNTAFHYEIQVSRDPGFNLIDVNSNSDTNIVSIPICNLYNFNTYYWRVRSNNLAGVSQWSSVRSFTTRPPSGWYAQNSTTPISNFKSVSFPDTLHGWAVGSSGKIIKTTSGGDCWNNQNSNTLTNLNSISFIDQNMGIAVGDSGRIIRTSNGGQNWILINGIVSQRLNSVLYVNVNTAYISGNNGLLYKSTNAGLNWIYLSSGTSQNLNSLSFINPLTGWVVGDSGKVLRTSNGGSNWFSASSGVSDHLNSIFIKNADTGWCVGNGGKILKTTNGGDSWQTLGSVITNDLTSISVSKDGILWAVGKDGKITASSTGGSNWVVHSSPTSQNLTHIYFSNGSNKAWCTGDNGIILHSSKGDITTNIASNSFLPLSFSLHQNYPNPFNPSTIISFELPNSSVVKLTIYNFLGKEIATLVNKTLSPGKYEFEWNARNLSSGIYFYRLEAAEFIETRKMVLLK